jgi:hypothetical protein
MATATTPNSARCARIELITAICWREQMTGSVEHQAMTASQIA